MHPRGDDPLSEPLMSVLLSVVIVLVIAGVLLYLLNTLVPMDARFKTVINCLVGLILFLYCVKVLWPLAHWP